jgi:hypothetical protein
VKARPHREAGLLYLMAVAVTIGLPAAAAVFCNERLRQPRFEIPSLEKYPMKTVRIAILGLLTVAAFASQDSSADDAKKKKAPPKRQPNPAMAKVDDVAGLPRVLLTVPVRELLKGKANVHRPLTNCGPTSSGVAQIDNWLGDGKWDVIHFNWGLHDLKYLGPQGQNLADPEAPGSHQQVPIDAYEANLRKLVARLQKTEAKLIWRSTTPVPEGAKGRVVGDSAKYNAVAKNIMDEHGIAIDDQYAFALPQLKKIQRPADVHFTPEGSTALAEQAVASILKALGK